MTEYLIRFLAGGAVVSAFAMLGDVLRPKSFAGPFGAAPSVALATLGIAIYQHGKSYAAAQTLSMVAGAIGLAIYRVVVSIVDPRTDKGATGNLAVARCLADRSLRPVGTRRRSGMSVPIRISSLREGRWYEYVIRFAPGGARRLFTGWLAAGMGRQSAVSSWPCRRSSAPAPRSSRNTKSAVSGKPASLANAAAKRLPRWTLPGPRSGRWECWPSP